MHGNAAAALCARLQGGVADSRQLEARATLLRSMGSVGIGVIEVLEAPQWRRVPAVQAQQQQPTVAPQPAPASALTRDELAAVLCWPLAVLPAVPALLSCAARLHNSAAQLSCSAAILTCAGPSVCRLVPCVAALVCQGGPYTAALEVLRAQVGTLLRHLAVTAGRLEQSGARVRGSRQPQLLLHAWPGLTALSCRVSIACRA